MTVLATEVKATYEVGDVVLVDALERDKKYRMYTNPDAYDTYVEGMTSNQIATITELSIVGIKVDGYYLDGCSYNYTDEMFVGKVIPIDDVDNLEEGELLLVTSDDATKINPKLLGELVTFDKILKRKGEVGNGAISILDLNDELISISFEGENLAISPEYIEGVVYNPLEHLSKLTKELVEACDELKAEVGEEKFEEIFTQVAIIALIETLAEESNDDVEELIRAIFGDEIEEGIATFDAGVSGHAWKEQAEEILEELDEDKNEMKVNLNVGTHVIETDSLNCNSLMTYNIHVEKIIHQNPATIVFYRTGAYDENKKFYVPEGSKLLKCVSKAQNGDVYDAQKGFMICMYKIFNRESAKRLKELYK